MNWKTTFVVFAIALFLFSCEYSQDEEMKDEQASREVLKLSAQGQDGCPNWRWIGVVSNTNGQNNFMSCPQMPYDLPFKAFSLFDQTSSTPIALRRFCVYHYNGPETTVPASALATLASFADTYFDTMDRDCMAVGALAGELEAAVKPF